MCEFCKDWNNIRDAEKKLGHEIEYCPNCGEPIYVVYALCAMKKAADKYLELHLLDGKRQETVEIDGVELVVEREKITNFGDPEMFTTEHRMSMKVDLDKVDISKEMEMLGLNFEPKTVKGSYGDYMLQKKFYEFLNTGDPTKLNHEEGDDGRN